MKTLAALAVAIAFAHPSWAQGVNVRIGVSATGTRVVIDSPTPVEVTPEPVQGSTITFVVDGLALPQTLDGRGQGLVEGWRLSSDSDGARLALRTVAESQIADSFLISPSGTATGYRYVIDLSSSKAAAPNPRPTAVAVDTALVSPLPKRAANAPETQMSKPKRYTAAALRSPPKKVVVIDAGHGGHDPGAQSADANEKDITLAAALDLRQRLLRDGRYKVVMTRSDDVFVPLEERVRIARRAGADLFIALHADSAGDNDATHGASVYTLSGHGETRVNEVLDGHEWFSKATPRDDPAVKGILLDLTQRSTLNRSNLFAQLLVAHLSESVDVLPKTHRDAGYFVLLAPDVPAVLLEMGFISSREDELRLKDPAKRDALMDTVAEAIDDYFDGNLKLAAD